MLRRERGAGAVFLFVVILLAMLFLVAVFMFSRMTAAVDAQAQTKTSLAAAAAALEQYAGVTGRLPCPANPTLDTGLADPTTPTTSCNSKTGTLPWATVGMRRDDAYDAWGWKISYRVYDGANGMTQDQGASMVNCDTSLTLGSAGVDANGLCRSTHSTLASEFIAGKGLSVTDFGTVYDGTKPSGGAAYVLISHGPSGFGAYAAAFQNTNAPQSAAEKNNLKATGPFTLMAASAADVAPGDNNHFDDVLRYRTVADLARRANLAARDWPDDLALTFTASNLQAALGLSSAPAAGSSLGTNLIYFGDALVAGSGNLSYDTRGGTPGIGVFGGGSTAINGTEYITVKFARSEGKVAISLSGFDNSEAATLAFFNGGAYVGSLVTLGGCQANGGGGGPLASFTVDPGVPFDQIGVTSWPYSSSFLVASVKSCASSDPTCLTTLDNGSSPPSGNHCP